MGVAVDVLAGVASGGVEKTAPLIGQKWPTMSFQKFETSSQEATSRYSVRGAVRFGGNESVGDTSAETRLWSWTVWRRLGSAWTRSMPCAEMPRFPTRPIWLIMGFDSKRL